MGKSQRDKGARGEREVVALLKDAGYDLARRGHQMYSKGGEYNADVMGLPGIHIEVKRTNSFRLWDALAQAKADCGKRLPTVWHRKDDCEWVVIMRAEDWLRLYDAYEQEGEF